VGTVSEDAKLPILQQVTEIIVLEIQKTFDFFRASAAGEHIERFTWRAVRRRCRDWWKRLRQEFSLPVELLNPFQRITPPPMGHGADWWSRIPARWQWRWAWP
jgi:Tfp pilus assembly PilM family ATPase